ncbi:LPS-assembly protein LptD [Limnochorda pilosa]|uniref:LPS-assembly protein LptD n=1 Tax=Limnochorda pilosa TaxID=1555112 RepID=A0A0K2SG18_LIMPI|nr:LPS-assembly protein LptD [Limnochorda pilosa]BAS25982.1 hypothetical protein LIP_0125 [Limnochorda pilosa]
MERGEARRDRRSRSPAPGPLPRARRGASRQGPKVPRLLATLLGLVLAGLTMVGAPASPVAAEALPARLQVNGEATYDPGSHWLSASQVRFQQGSLTVESDWLEADLARQTVIFSGQVRLDAEGGRWEGEQLTYALDTGRFSLDQGTAEVQAPGAQGPLRLRVPRVDGSPSRIHLGGASLTTCGLDKPEYHVRAREIEIEPGRRMVLRHVVYVEGSIPLFYWPQVTIPLDEEGGGLGASPFEPPEVGWSEEDGWYLRTTYYYDTRAERLGALHAGYHQYSGWGLGVTQRLPLGPASWTVGADWLQNPPSEARDRAVAEPRYRLRTRLELPADPGAPVRATYQGEYWELRPQGTPVRGDWSLADDLTVSAEVGGVQAALTAHQERSVEDGVQAGKEGADVTVRRTVGPLTLRVEARGRRWQEDDTVKEHLGYLGAVEARAGGWDAAVRDGWTLHPNLLAYKDPSGWIRFGRNPEAELGYTLPSTLWVGPMRGTRLRLSAQDGRYAEEDVKGTSSEWIHATHLEARSSSTRIPLGAGLSLGAGAWAGDWAYETGERLDYAGTSWTLQVRPSAAFIGELGYTVQQAWGETPFVSHRDVWNDRERVSLLLEADLRPLRVGAYASYDLLEQSADDLVGLVELRPSPRLQVGAAAHYSVPDEEFTRYDARVAVGLSERWWLEGQAAYTFDPADPDKGTVPLRSQVSLKYTSDCRTVSLRFDGATKTVWLEYRLNAFPASPLQLGREAETEEPTLFDLPDMKAVVRQVTSS